jgi:hypothetical protein
MIQERKHPLLAGTLWILDMVKMDDGTDVVMWHSNMGEIPSSVEFFDMVSKCTKFYEYYSDKEIAHLNAAALELNNSGRRTYSDEKKKENNAGYIYLIKSTSGHHKIGKSKDPERRLAELKKGLTIGPFDLEIVSYHEVSDMDTVESYYHNLFKKERIGGEWFLLSEEGLR